MILDGGVLVVDDDESSRTLLVDLLEFDGHRVIQAADGAEALAIFDRQPVALVLLDLMMPRVDGFAVLDQLMRRPASSRPQVVVVTARALRTIRLEALRRGARDYITKPVDPIEVRVRVRNLLGLTGDGRPGTFRALVEALPDTVLVVTAEGGIAYASGPLDGTHAAALRGQPVAEVFPPAERDAVTTAMADACAGSEVVVYTTREDDGGASWMYRFRRTGAEGAVLVVVTALARNVTEG